MSIGIIGAGALGSNVAACWQDGIIGNDRKQPRSGVTGEPRRRAWPFDQGRHRRGSAERRYRPGSPSRWVDLGKVLGDSARLERPGR